MAHISPTIQLPHGTTLNTAQTYAANGILVHSVYALGQVGFFHRQPDQPDDAALTPTPQQFVDNHRGYLRSFRSLVQG